MGLIRLNSLIRVSIVALLATSFVVVGCGDGKKKRRQSMTKSTGNKSTPDKTVADPLAPPAKTGDVSKSDLETNIQGKYEEQAGGSALDKTALLDGSYKLSKVVTFVKNMEDSNNWLIAFRSQDLTLDANGAPFLSDDATEGSGFSADAIDNVRHFEVPLEILVAQPFAATRTDFNGYVLLKTFLKQSAGKLELDNNFDNANPESASVKTSVQELLATGGTATDNGAEISLRMVKVSDNQIRLVFEVVEIKDLKFRNVVLTYDLTEAAAAAAPVVDPSADPTAVDPSAEGLSPND